jgi:hypothetical protein
MDFHVTFYELIVIFMAGAVTATMIHEGIVHPRLARHYRLVRRLAGH